MDSKKKKQFNLPIWIKVILIVLFTITILFVVAHIVIFLGFIINSNNFIFICSIIFDGTLRLWGLYVTIALTFIGLIANHLFKDNAKSKIKRLAVLFFAVTFFTIPLAISAYGAEAVDEYKQTIKSTKNIDDNITTNETSSLRPKFTIDFDDILLESYDYKDIHDNEDLLIKQIINLINSEINNFNKGADKDKFSKYTEQASDYEIVFKYCYDNKLFLVYNRNERSKFITCSNSLREKADTFYKDSINQYLIAVGFINLADEQYSMNDYDSAIDSYSNAITWSLTALRTSYNEYSNEHHEEMFDNIIKSYSNIAQIYSSYSNQKERKDKAIFLKSIYISIKENY